jgi:hypothetical protein
MNRAFLTFFVLCIVVLAGCPRGGRRPAPSTGRDAGPGRLDGGTGDDGGARTCEGGCDDGLACNGVESCEDGTCVGSPAMNCEDAFACTRDSCVEPGTCQNVDDDALCGPSMVCNAGVCMPGTPVCPTSPCSIEPPQCGCTGGQACTLNDAGARFCSPPGAVREGAVCTRSTDCGVGLICTGAAPARMCRRACSADTDCAAGSACLLSVTDVTPPIGLCNTVCDLRSGSGCPAGATCLVGQEELGAMRFFTECAGPVGTGRQGAACTTFSQCAIGFGCVGSQCVQWCREGFAGDCPTPTVCGSGDGLPVGGVVWNICT